MEFRRYIRERVNQLREDEALNITETTPEGRGIRKVRFNPETARSLVQLPNHKKIVFNPKYSLRGVDNFLTLGAYDKKKIDQSLRKTTRRDRDDEIFPPPATTKFINNPSAIYIYANTHYYNAGSKAPLDGQIQIWIFISLNNKFYKVLHYLNGWNSDFFYNHLGSKIEDNKQIYIDDGTIRLEAFPTDEDYPTTVSIYLKVDFLGYAPWISDLKAENMTFERDPNFGYWFCKQLDGEMPSRVYYGDELDPGAYRNCPNRGITPSS